MPIRVKQKVQDRKGSVDLIEHIKVRNEPSVLLDLGENLQVRTKDMADKVTVRKRKGTKVRVNRRSPIVLAADCDFVYPTRFTDLAFVLGSSVRTTGILGQTEAGLGGSAQATGEFDAFYYPTGDWIYYVGGSAHQIRRIHPDGTGDVAVRNHPGGSNGDMTMVLHPGGEKVIVVDDYSATNAKGLRIIEYDLPNLDNENILHAVGDLNNNNYSIDYDIDRQVYYVSSGDFQDAGRITRINWDGSGAVLLTPAIASDDYRTISYDPVRDKVLLCIGNSSSQSGLYSFDFDGSNAQLIGAFPNYATLPTINTRYHHGSDTLYCSFGGSNDPDQGRIDIYDIDTFTSLTTIRAGDDEVISRVAFLSIST